MKPAVTRLVHAAGKPRRRDTRPCPCCHGIGHRAGYTLTDFQVGLSLDECELCQGFGEIE